MSKYSAERPAGREHIPNYPKAFVALRIVQLVVAVIILGLIAYSLSLLVFSGNCLNIFTAIASLIISVYYLVCEFGPAKAYNYWAILALDIFMVIFWLISFALLASQVAPFMSGYTECGYYSCYKVSLEGTSLTVAACLAAASGLGGLEFLLYIISLAIHSVVMHRHRSAGLHCKPAIDGEAATASAPVTTGNEKPQINPVYTAVPQQQQEQFQQQPVPVQSYPQQPAVYPQQTMTPPPQHGYSAHIAQPAPYYPQQTPSPLHQQHPGGAYPQQPVAPPQPGYYEAQGQQIPYQHNP